VSSRLMNHSKLKRGLSFHLLLGCICWSASAAVIPAAPGFLFIENVPGESIEKSHLGWIEIHGFQHRFGWRAGDSDARARSLERSFDELRIVKQVDKASPRLIEGLTRGTVYPSAVLEFVLADNRSARFYRIKLENVSVAGLDLSAQSAGPDVEEARLRFETIEWTYTEFAAGGRPLTDHTAYWDLLRNEGSSTEVRHGFRVEAARGEEGALHLRWPARAGQQYLILTSESVSGPYRSLQTTTAESDAGEAVLPVGGPFHFFIVQEEEP
jgi:type VI secretion system Hcp family effector